MHSNGLKVFIYYIFFVLDQKSIETRCKIYQIFGFSLHNPTFTAHFMTHACKNVLLHYYYIYNFISICKSWLFSCEFICHFLLERLKIINKFSHLTDCIEFEGKYMATVVLLNVELILNCVVFEILKRKYIKLGKSKYKFGRSFCSNVLNIAHHLISTIQSYGLQKKA